MEPFQVKKDPPKPKAVIRRIKLESEFASQIEELANKNQISFNNLVN